MFVSMLLGFMSLAFAEAKCKAAPALAEDITLDDPFAEMTAPAEAGNIVKDEVTPRISRLYLYVPFFSFWLQNQVLDWF